MRLNTFQNLYVDQLNDLYSAENQLVAALPKTRNGKILRRVARASYIGSAPGDLSSMEDPAVLEAWPRTDGTSARKSPVV